VTATNSTEYKHTQSAQCKLVKTDTTEQFIASLEVEQPSYRNFLTLMFANPQHLVLHSE